VKIENGKKETSFYLKGIKNKSHRSEIQNALAEDSNIYLVEIFPDDKCHIILNQLYDADYIVKILSPLNITIEKSFVSVKEISDKNALVEYDVLTKNNQNLPDGFPVREYTGDDKKDEEILAKKVKEWRENHPDEWNKMLENRKK
jgi:hypothetical protein